MSKRANKRQKGFCFDDRPKQHPCAAGIDIGAREIFVAVHQDPEQQPVRRFGTFTQDLEQIADWLVSCGVTTVAMESTGVYWIPLFEILEVRGLNPYVVNARHMKNVPGRRTDWHECQWIQLLHSMGLLRSGFRPEDQVCQVRAIVRHRQELVTMAARHVQHMQKSLTQMNLQIHHVINDISGSTGLAIVDAIVGGERDPIKLAKLRHRGIRAEEETIVKSLQGNWRKEHMFTLQQSLEAYRFCLGQLASADQLIESLVGEFTPRVDPELRPLPKDGKKNRGESRRRRKTGNTSAFDLRTEAYKLFGVDVTQIPGLETNVVALFSELGRDMTRWPTVGHFVSWLSLCPDNDISGGKVLWRGARKTNNRAGQIFRMAAVSVQRSQHAMAENHRRLKAKLGPAAAVCATARKIATVFYTIVGKQVEYDNSIWEQQEKLRDERGQARLERQAAKRGYKLVPANAGSLGLPIIQQLT
jgi:transposase